MHRDGEGCFDSRRRVNSIVRRRNLLWHLQKLISMIAPFTRPPIPARVQAYLEALVRTSGGSGRALVSIVLFGSSATGGFSAKASDVDLILIVSDGTSEEDRRRLREAAERIEALHGFRENHAHPHRGSKHSLKKQLLTYARSSSAPEAICSPGA